MRSVLWKKILNKANREVRDRGLSQDRYAGIKEALRTLMTLSDARDAGGDALSVYRYFYEDKLKYDISSTLLDQVDFGKDASMLLTNEKVRHVCASLNRHLKVLQVSESRIVKRLPISVVTVVCSMLLSEDKSRELKWWLEDSSVLLVASAAKD